MNPELSFYNCSRSTKLLLFLLLSGIEILMCEGESNISLTIEEENQNVACRTERRSYLPYDQYKIDTCARCYHYMPHNSFKNKFRYRWQLLGLLKDDVTNKSFEADPFNASTAILESFSEESFIYKWRGCCVAAMECCERMVSMPTLVSDSAYCPRTWDGWQCWDDTPGGTTAVNVCAGHIYFLNEPPSCPKYAYKVCWPNGTWYENYNRREWTNYTKCGRTDEHRRQLYFHVATYSISVISMVPALIIFSVYKQLQVHRISMHKNLFVSFFFKGLAVVLFKFFVVIDEFNRSPTYVTIMAYNSIACRILLIFTKYFKMTNYMWMFCEGYYLHKLIAAAFAEQKNLIMFYIIGWVFPLIPVCIYAVLRITQANEKCWAYPIESYEWIMNGPNMLSLMVNLVFLCNIIRVLVTKLRATHSNEPSQYRKAVRATLVLVPLFGLHFCLVIYRPQSGPCGLIEAYNYFSHALDGLQGFIVSLIFCYMNGEVLYLLKRSYKRYKLSSSLHGRGQSSMMMHPVSCTQMTSLNESQAAVPKRGLHWRNSRNGERPREATASESLEDDIVSV